MPEMRLSAGTIDYVDTGGDGPPVVLLHGLLMSATVWEPVIERLRGTYRCIAPTLPLGAHRRAMAPGADLSGAGIARIAAELLDALDVRDVTLVGHDWGGAQLMVAHGLDARVGRLVLASQEAFDNVPPGLPGRAIWLASKVPGGVWLVLQQMRIPAARRLPMTFGWMSKRPVPRATMDGWLAGALGDAGVRHDLAAYVSSVRRGEYAEAAEALRGFDRPALVVWAGEDRVMPVEHGRRLAQLLPHARYVEVPDSRTLLQIDQPQAFADAIAAFATAGQTAAGAAA